MATATATAKVTEAFRIVDPCKLITANHNTIGPAVFGEIAHVPGHGRIARWSVRGNSGVSEYAYMTAPSDPDVQPVSLRPPRDEASAAIDKFSNAQSIPREKLHKIEPSPLELESAKFAAAWPELSQHLGLVRLKPPERIFEIGACWRKSAFDPISADVDWAAFRDKHAAGDFGENGRYDPAALQDQGVAWSVGLQSQGVKNAWNVMRRAGCVRSTFLIPGRADKLAVHVTTIQSAIRETFTILHVHQSDQPY